MLTEEKPFNLNKLHVLHRIEGIKIIFEGTFFFLSFDGNNNIIQLLHPGETRNYKLILCLRLASLLAYFSNVITTLKLAGLLAVMSIGTPKLIYRQPNSLAC